jgi:hypothetical protein
MLTADQRKLFRIALGSKGLVSPHSLADGIADQIDALHVIAPAADVPANSPASAVTIALSTANTYSDSAVNTAVNAALASAVADINADRLQINAILTALKAASIMS